MLLEPTTAFFSCDGQHLGSERHLSRIKALGKEQVGSIDRDYTGSAMSKKEELGGVTLAPEYCQKPGQTEVRN